MAQGFLIRFLHYRWQVLRPSTVLVAQSQRPVPCEPVGHEQHSYLHCGCSLLLLVLCVLMPLKIEHGRFTRLLHTNTLSSSN